MGIRGDDRRRCVGAIEATLMKRLRANHTWTSEADLIATAGGLLNTDNAVVRFAVTDAVKVGAIVPIGAGFSLPGCNIMERFCADRISSMATGKFEAAQLSLRRRWTKSEVEAELLSFERSEDLALNPEQRQSVQAVVVHQACLLVGGPGVGKTTVLKAIHHVAEKMDIVVHQAALSGRATQRMKEATGRSASTIASLLIRADKGEIALGDGVLLIIDESSMIDLATLYRLVSHFKPGVRLLLVGDTGQLPPIGFGLTFHVLAENTGIPKTELRRVMRQSAESGIPEVCAAIRSGRPPALRSSLHGDDGVAFIEAATDDLVGSVMDVVAKLGGIGRAQIIGSVKSGAGGTFEFNTQFQAVASVGRSPLCDRFVSGDPIIATRNDYDIGIMNGDLGVAMGETADHELEADFNGRRIVLPRDYLQNVDLAYAITCHKSQGSQFERVIIPVTRSRLMDRTLLLTAVSRGHKQLFLVGDRAGFDDAIISTPGANLRQVGLRHYLNALKELN